jgi:pimeloyl-ACP methyl ester carboxylesterase
MVSIMGKIKVTPHKYTDYFHGERVDFIGLTDGRQIAYKRSGHGEHTVIDFHGSPGGRLNPVPRNQKLNLLGLNVISFDRPGYGHSSRNSGRRIIDTAYDVEQILEALDIERVGLIARSGGVPHALGTAALLGSRVSALVGISGVAPRNAIRQWDQMTKDNQQKHLMARDDIWQLSHNMYKHAKEVQATPNALFKHISKDFPHSDTKFFESNPTAKGDIIDNHECGLLKGAEGWIDDSIALNNFTWGFSINTITCPSVFWHGAQDPFSHVSQTHTLRKLVPGAVSVIDPDEGHFGGLKFVWPALGYIRSRIHVEERDGKPSQAAIGELAELFKPEFIYPLGTAPRYPMVEAHDPVQ